MTYSMKGSIPTVPEGPNPLYLLAIGVSLLSAELALAIYALLGLFYLFDVLPPLESGEVRKHPPGHSLLGRPKAKAGGRRTE